MSDNIQVVVRCRKRNRQESEAKSPVVIELPSDTFTAHEPFVTVQNETSSFLSKTPNTALKTFKVDQVYGPGAEQALVFENVAAPLFDDFVAGLNVTLLAYGQTGSGKTHTMCGDLQGENAGIIPRVLSQLFAQTANVDCCVKISCAELYKEELHDLINDDLDLIPVKTKLRLVSEPSRDMGVASIQNLTELTIDSSEMGFKVLQNCLSKRRTSATKLNDRSSRLHTIFSILLYQKADGNAENPPYRVLKMNLVDLAGSEDIHKSGAVNERAREAGSINQSLLTLGKVISCLSEGKESRHIPYRESKLTRLLQGLIGGKTKTALIATISPARINVQETLSTLTYAAKAKNIKNLPQSTHSSQSVLKKVLVKDLSSQIARLTRDLIASKDKDDGIKMSLQNYQTYGDSIRELESNAVEKDTEIKRLSLKLEAKVLEVETLRQKLEIVEKDSSSMELKYQEKSAQLLRISNDLTALTNRHGEQNKRVQQIVESNVFEINEMIQSTISLLSSGRNNTSKILSKGSKELISCIDNSRQNLHNSMEELNKSLEAEARQNLSELVKKNLDVSLELEQLRNFTFDAESLHNNRKKLQQMLHDGESPQTLLEKTANEIRQNNESAEQKIYLKIEASLKSIFAENEAKNKRALEMATKSISDSNQQFQKAVEASSSEHRSLVDGLLNKSLDLRKRVRNIETEFVKRKASLSQEIGSLFQSMVKKSFDELDQKNTRECLRVTNHINGALSSMAPELHASDEKAISKLRTTNSGMSEFQTKIETLRNSLEVGDRLTSPSIKRRKPMSPIRQDNTLYRSRIPQLSPGKL